MDKDDGVSVLPDGSAFFVGSTPLPTTHWLYAPMEYKLGSVEPDELPEPVLSHAEHRAVAVAAARYAVRATTSCGQVADFDPDAWVQNMVYALCGPYGDAK